MTQPQLLPGLKPTYNRAMPEGYLTTKQAAERLERSGQATRDLSKHGWLKAEKFGFAWMLLARPQPFAHSSPPPAPSTPETVLRFACPQHIPVAFPPSCSPLAGPPSPRPTTAPAHRCAVHSTNQCLKHCTGVALKYR